MENNFSDKLYHSAIAFFVVAGILSLTSAAMAGLWHRPAPISGDTEKHQDKSVCGLPESLFVSRPDFLATICPDSKTIFAPAEPRALMLTEMGTSEGGESAIKNDFFSSGQPNFFRSDPPSYGEIIEYTPGKKQAIEIVVSEPDFLAYLWDIESSKVYSVAQCGTACRLEGAFWISASRFVIYGSEELDGPSRKFVRVYDLAQRLSEEYLAN